MSRGPSYDDVRNAFFEVLKEGGNPSFEAIYTRIGRRGGNDVVRRLINEVKLEAAQLHEKLILARAPGVPEPLVDILNEFIRTSWDLALSTAQSNFEQARESLALREKALNEENEGLRTAIDEAVQKTVVLQMQLASTEREREERDERIRSQSEEVERLTSRCEDLHNQIAQFQRRIGELEASVQAERERGDNALNAATQRHEEALESLTAQNQRVISDLRAEFDRQMSLAEDRANGERKHLMQETDDLRQDLLREKQALKQAVEDANTSAQKTREETRTARAEVAVLKERLAEANGRAIALESITAMLQEHLAKNEKEPEHKDGN